jgi:hypothetical protein
MAVALGAPVLVLGLVHILQKLETWVAEGAPLTEPGSGTGHESASSPSDRCANVREGGWRA